MKKLVILITAINSTFSVHCQVTWQKTLNNAAGGAPNFGTSYSAPINIFTNYKFTSQFTVNNALSGLNTPGDGLVIRNQDPFAPPGTGALSLWTSASNGTEVRWGASGNVAGRANRLEMWGNYAGLFFNASNTGGIGVIKFARSGYVNGYVGTNTFWRIGDQSDGAFLDGERRLHVVDDKTQIRLSFSVSNANGTFYTDFLSNNIGNLQIQPSGGRVGINLSLNPTSTLDVNGNVRIRNVAAATPNSILIGVNANGNSDVNVRRLDFTGNATQVLLGNGTWGTLPSTAPLANNGVSRNLLFNGPYQLGDVYNNFFFNTNTPLTANRQVRLNGRDFIFSGNGNVGFGLSFPNLPTERIDVNGNARFREVPIQGGQSLILGLQNGSNANDIELSRLSFPNDPNVFLNGNGSWSPGIPGPQGPAGNTIGAHNGTSLSILDPTKVSLGQNINQVGNPGKLLSNREIPMNDQYMIFTDNGTTNNSLNRIGIGVQFPQAKLHISYNNIGAVSQPVTLRADNHYAGGSGSFTFGENITVDGQNDGNNGMFIQSSNGNLYNVGIDANATGGNGQNTAIFGRANNGLQNNTGFIAEAFSYTNQNVTSNTGIVSRGALGLHNRGGVFDALSNGNTGSNIGLIGTANGNGSYTYGVWGIASGNATVNYGVFGQANGTGTTRAGYFAGIVEGTSTPIFGSDQQFKTNVTGLNNSLKLLSLLKPHAYYFDTINYSRFNFSTKLQFGFIAQEIEQLFPNLVHNSILPAKLDSIGNEISPSVTYKSLNYNAFIPLNTAAIIELNQKIEKATLSDQSIKTNVLDLNGSLNKVLNMRGVSYDWDQTVHPELNLDSLNHIGFIAQEMAQIDPRVTYITDDSLLHIEYDKVVPLLAEAIQELNFKVDSMNQNANSSACCDSLTARIINLEVQNTQQQTQIDNLTSRLNQLENCLSGILPLLCQLNQQAINTNDPIEQEKIRSELSVKLSNKEAIILDQNIPNPFAEQTIINFSVPETVKKAQIHFYDGMGKIIQSVDIVDRGLGSITVFGADLSSGIYTYTLVADGQIVATKKMMKQ